MDNELSKQVEALQLDVKNLSDELLQRDEKIKALQNDKEWLQV